MVLYLLPSHGVGGWRGVTVTAPPHALLCRITAISLHKGSHVTEQPCSGKPWTCFPAALPRPAAASPTTQFSARFLPPPGDRRLQVPVCQHVCHKLALLL